MKITHTASNVAPRFDCRSCGACCGPTEDRETYVDVDAHDLVRLSKRYQADHVSMKYRALRTKRDHNGVVCVALRGSIGKRVACAIYARRPTLCRTFVVGSAACLDARTEVGLPV